MQALEIVAQSQRDDLSWTLYGKHRNCGWLFYADYNDRVSHPDWTDVPRHATREVETWADALSLYDEQPWFRFEPVFVHMDFRDAIWDAFQDRANKFGSSSLIKMQWTECCSAR